MKETIRCFLETYEEARSIWKIGIFSYLADQDTVSTLFYDYLKNFYIYDLQEHSQLKKLDEADIDKLKKIVDECADIYPWDVIELRQENPAIFELFNNVRALVENYEYHQSVKQPF